MHNGFHGWWKVLLVMALVVLGALMLLIGLLIRSPTNRWGWTLRRLGTAFLGTGLAGWWILANG